MKPRLKIVFTWSVLLLMIYNMIGYVIVFELASVFNRESMERLLSYVDDSKLERIKVSDASHVTRNGDEEIIYEGRHYDVKKEVVENGYTCYYCIHDNDEEDLYTGLNDSVNVNAEAQTDGQALHAPVVLKNFTKDLFFQQHVEKLEVASAIHSSFNNDERFSTTVFLAVVIPPPKALAA